MFAALKLVKMEVSEVRFPIKKNSRHFCFEKSSEKGINMT